MHRARLFLSLFALTGLLAGFLPGMLGAQEAAPAGQVPTDTVVIRYYFKDRDQLNAVAGQLDTWEVHLDQGYAVAMVTPQEYQQLQGLGYRPEIDPEKTALLGIEAPLDPRFYYYDSNYANSYNRYMVDFLVQTATISYTNITELFNAGSAWQGLNGGYVRPIYFLRITNEDPRYGPIADKPAFVLHADIHAREVTTPEMAIRYIKYLTSGYNGQGGYGVNPDVTWMVDWNVAYILVTANPDGHRVDEQDTSVYRRKNMNNTDGCTDPYSWGVDLNRNHDFQWGCCDGSSGAPCDETYRGHARSSEPETFAFQNFITMNNILRDQNGPNGPDELPPAAPLTTTGILMSLHSYQDEVLWPWGFQAGGAPNEAQLRTIGRKLGYYSTYVPVGFLYTVDGDTHDWSYGQLGVASFVFEIGPTSGICGDFFPSYDCMEGQSGAPQNFWNENRPAFIYMHKIARTPYLTSYGPDADTLAVNPNPVERGTAVNLSAHIQDHRYGGDPLANVGAAEYFFDQPGADGTGTAMIPQDGSWGGSSETAIATVETCDLTPGQHYILVHGQSTTGYWGPFSAVFLSVVEPAQCDAVQIDDVITATTECTTTFAASLGGTCPFTYTWDFGPFGTSSEPTPTVDFVTSGTYPFSLTVTNCQTGTASVTGTVSCCVPPLDAAFAWAPTDPRSGQDITFDGSATGPGISYAWDFGDDTTGSGATAHHTYAAGGDYLVTMTATNCAPAVVTQMVHVCDSVRDTTFTWTPAAPRSGQDVAFDGTAAGEGPISYAWSFGDDTTGSGASAHHTYAAGGDYLVTLTTTNSCNSQVATQTVHICDSVHDTAFTWAPPSPRSGQAVTFDGSAAGESPISYSWSFGDNATGSGATVSHTYATGGSYPVVLTAANGCNAAAVTQTVDVCTSVHDANFTWAPPAASVGLPITFDATAAGDDPLSYTWTFGDGGSGAGQQISHTYSAAGDYTVILTAHNCQGAATVALHSVHVDPFQCEAAQIVTVTAAISGCAVTFGADATGTTPFEYDWDFGSFGSSTQPTPTVNFRTTGTYTATLDLWNCGHTELAHFSRTVHVECAAPPYWYIYLPVVFRAAP